MQTPIPERRHLPNPDRSTARGLAVALSLWSASLACASEALPNYVNIPDSSFSWKCTEKKRVEEGTVCHLELVSQTWRGQFWSHHLQVLRPSTVRNPATAFLYITGDGEGEKDLKALSVLASRAGAVVAILTKVPNQPLYEGRQEDSLLAYTLDQYLRTGDATWPLLFPMVKSAVRAIDTVQAFALDEWQQKIDRFVLGGASKRGWTAWLTAAVEPRVKALAPMVIDMLNMRAQLKWAGQVYGEQSEQIHDYTELHLHQRLDDLPMQKLRSWIDPFSYRDRYAMPKLLLLGTNDPYWTVDSLRHYWDDLPGPKLIFQTPNAGHDLAGGQEAISTLAAWFQMIADGQPLPQLDWQIQIEEQSAHVSVHLNQPAKHFRLWTATATKRDFRNEKWSSRELERKTGNREASVSIPKPIAGYQAFLVEAELDATTGDAYKISTEARVIPDTTPR